MNARITIIYGAPATGKTYHSGKFRRHYRAKRIVDDWPFALHGRRLKSGDLALTNNVGAALDAERKSDGRIRAVDIATAKREALQ